jgi:hypothetical protein
MLARAGGRSRLDAAADLRVFALRVSSSGVCAAWTTAAPARSGTRFDVALHGKLTKDPSGTSILRYGYGFGVQLGDGAAEVTDRPRGGGSRVEPRVIEARIGQTGRTLSVFVPRSQLDQAPASVHARPPFPYREFIFSTGIEGPRERSGTADAWPEPPTADAGYLNGRLCLAPCPALDLR